jgi:hypothetical protein
MRTWGEDIIYTRGVALVEFEVQPGEENLLALLPRLAILAPGNHHSEEIRAKLGGLSSEKFDSPLVL